MKDDWVFVEGRAVGLRGLDLSGCGWDIIVAQAKLLFVCVENSNRSQMSQAFAKMLGGDAVEVSD